MSTFSRSRKKRRREFERRLKDNGGPDRIIGAWQMIDVHEVPDLIGENLQITPSFAVIQEFDFYCGNQKDWYLLRITKSKEVKYSIVKSKSARSLIYLIAEINFETLTDDFIEKILKHFEKRGIPKYGFSKINLSFH